MRTMSDVLALAYRQANMESIGNWVKFLNESSRRISPGVTVGERQATNVLILLMIESEFWPLWRDLVTFW